MIKILKEVHSICMKNNIKYFLHFGTLIGAVRHNGFIPWDDDIDIGMLRPDYEKFLKIVKNNLSKDYIVQNQKTDKGFAFCFTKIMLQDTVWIEQNSIRTNKKYNGIYIDVFPFDKVPEKERKPTGFRTPPSPCPKKSTLPCRSSSRLHSGKSRGPSNGAHLS